MFSFIYHSWNNTIREVGHLSSLWIKAKAKHSPQVWSLKIKISYWIQCSMEGWNSLVLAYSDINNERQWKLF